MRGDKKYLAITFVLITLIGVLFFNTIHVQKEEELKSLESKILKNKNNIAAIKEFNSIHKNFDEEATELADRHFRVYMAFPEKLNEENIRNMYLNSENSSKNNLLTLDLEFNCYFSK